MSQISTPSELTLPRRFLDSRAAAWLFAAALGLLLVGESAKYTLKVMKGGSAILRWYELLAAFCKGEAIGDVYPNPPIMALILSPLTALSPVSACLLWLYIKAGLTVLSFFWLFRWVGNCRPAAGALDRQQATPFPFWGMALTVLLSLRPILGDLDHGNVNLFILFLVVAFLTALHYRRDLLSGLILGLAIACKVTPALFLPYLMWKRSWKALAGSAAGLILFLWPGFFPASLIGWKNNEENLRQWYHSMVRPFVVEGKITTEMSNQSLPGVVFRLLTASPADSQWSKEEDRFIPTRYANVLSLDPAQARWIVKGCMGLFALLVVWSCRTPLERSGGWRLSAEMSLIVIGMLLFSERTWKHHCVTLALPFAVLCYYLSACSPSRGLAAYLIATLAAASLLIASTSNGLLPERWAETAQVYGPYVLANVLLIVALVVLLRREIPLSSPLEGDRSGRGG